MDESKRGVFICLEGVDHCGKTTQARLLSAHLDEKCVKNKVIRFPERNTATGELLDAYLKNNAEISHTSLHLLFSANRWEFRDYIESLLSEGTTVIADRYVYSGSAYSIAKGLDAKWCKAVDVGLPEPDVVIYLDAKINQAYLDSRSRDKGTERHDDVDYLNRVDAAFKAMPFAGIPWFFLDASNSVENLGRLIALSIESTLKISSYLPIHHIKH